MRIKLLSCALYLVLNSVNVYAGSGIVIDPADQGGGSAFGGSGNDSIPPTGAPNITMGLGCSIACGPNSLWMAGSRCGPHYVCIRDIQIGTSCAPLPPGQVQESLCGVDPNNPPPVDPGTQRLPGVTL